MVHLVRFRSKTISIRYAWVTLYASIYVNSARLTQVIWMLRKNGFCNRNFRIVQVCVKQCMSHSSYLLKKKRVRKWQENATEYLLRLFHRGKGDRERVKKNEQPWSGKICNKLFHSQNETYIFVWVLGEQNKNMFQLSAWHQFSESIGPSSNELQNQTNRKKIIKKIINVILRVTGPRRFQLIL